MGGRPVNPIVAYYISQFRRYGATSDDISGVNGFAIEGSYLKKPSL
jgi:hypothetical protein